MRRPSILWFAFCLAVASAGLLGVKVYESLRLNYAELQWDRLELARYHRDDIMREVGICLWRDKLHELHQDKVWASNLQFRGDMLRWCGKEPIGDDAQ